MAGAAFGAGAIHACASIVTAAFGTSQSANATARSFARKRPATTNGWAVASPAARSSTIGSPATDSSIRSLVPVGRAAPTSACAAARSRSLASLREIRFGSASPTRTASPLIATLPVKCTSRSPTFAEGVVNRIDPVAASSTGLLRAGAAAAGSGPGSRASNRVTAALPAVRCMPSMVEMERASRGGAGSARTSAGFEAPASVDGSWAR